MAVIRLAKCSRGLQISALPTATVDCGPKGSSKSNDTNNNNKLLLTFVVAVVVFRVQPPTTKKNTKVHTMEHLRLEAGLLWRCVGVRCLAPYAPGSVVCCVWCVCVYLCVCACSLWPRTRQQPASPSPLQHCPLHSRPDQTRPGQARRVSITRRWLSCPCQHRMYSFPKGITYVRSGHNKFLRWKCQLGADFVVFLFFSCAVFTVEREKSNWLAFGIWLSGWADWNWIVSVEVCAQSREPRAESPQPENRSQTQLGSSSIWIYTCRSHIRAGSCCHLAVKWWHKRTYALTHQWGDTPSGHPFAHSLFSFFISLSFSVSLCLSLMLSLCACPCLAGLIGTSVTGQGLCSVCSWLCLLTARS